jgi:hypothetical protein
MRPADTSPEAWKKYSDLLRQMTPEQKLQRAFVLSARLRERTAAALRQRYPNAGDREVFLRTAASHFGRDLFKAVYGKELDYRGEDDGLMEEIRQEMDRNLVRDLLCEYSQ